MAEDDRFAEVSRGTPWTRPESERKTRAREAHRTEGKDSRPTTTHLLDQSIHLLVGDELLLRQSGDQAIVVRHGHARDAALRGSRVGMCVRRQTTNGFGRLLLFGTFRVRGPRPGMLVLQRADFFFFFLVKRAPSLDPSDPVAHRRLKRLNNNTETAGRSIARADLRITRYGSSVVSLVLVRSIGVSLVAAAASLGVFSRRRRRRGALPIPPPPPAKTPAFGSGLKFPAPHTSASFESSCPNARRRLSAFAEAAGPSSSGTRRSKSKRRVRSRRRADPSSASFRARKTPATPTAGTAR